MGIILIKNLIKNGQINTNIELLKNELNITLAPLKRTFKDSTIYYVKKLQFGEIDTGNKNQYKKEFDAYFNAIQWNH